MLTIVVMLHHLFQFLLGKIYLFFFVPFGCIHGVDAVNVYILTGRRVDDAYPNHDVLHDLLVVEVWGTAGR